MENSNETTIQVKSLRTKPGLVISLLLLSDSIGFYLSYVGATKIRQLLIPWIGGKVGWPIYQPMAWLGMGLLVILLYFNDMYPGYGLAAVKEMEKTVKSITIVYLFWGFSFYILKTPINFSRSIFILAWLISFFAIFGMRIIIRNRLSLTPIYGKPIAYITDHFEHGDALEAISTCRRMGWKLFTVLKLDNDSEKESSAVDVLIVKSVDELLTIAREYQINTVLLDIQTGDYFNDKNPNLLNIVGEEFKHMILLYPFYNLGPLSVEPRDLEGQLCLEFHYRLLEPNQLLIKRISDIIGASILLILSFPLMIFIAIMIRLDSPGPILFSHERVGRSGKKIYIIKFRTMIKDAQMKLDKYLKENPSAEIEFKKHQKLKDDFRITRLGNWLRKFSLDELPQLWNVLRGDISLIGPRAITVGEVDKYGKYAQLILRAPPGITGWWQVMGRHKATWERRIQLETYYVSNWSPWMDLYITLKTIWVVITGQGA